MMTTSSPRTPDLRWDRIAAVYDRQLWLERRPLTAAVELAAAQKHERLLDVATGTGALLRLMAATRRHPDRVVGLDASRAMLARAHRLPYSWKLVVGDASDMPFEESSFDVATCAYLLHLLERDARAQVLAECRRVLRPAGRLVTVTVAIPQTFVGRAAALPFAILRRVAPTRFPGLGPLDPCPDIEAAGFVVQRSQFVSLGYPSICILATRHRR